MVQRIAVGVVGLLIVVLLGFISFMLRNPSASSQSAVAVPVAVVASGTPVASGVGVPTRTALPSPVASGTPVAIGYTAEPADITAQARIQAALHAALTQTPIPPAACYQKVIRIGGTRTEVIVIDKPSTLWDASSKVDTVFYDKSGYEVYIPLYYQYSAIQEMVNQQHNGFEFEVRSYTMRSHEAEQDVTLLICPPLT